VRMLPPLQQFQVAGEELKRQQRRKPTIPPAAVREKRIARRAVLPPEGVPPATDYHLSRIGYVVGTGTARQRARASSIVPATQSAQVRRNVPAVSFLQQLTVPPVGSNLT
jgi:hypothetical protein